MRQVALSLRIKESCWNSWVESIFSVPTHIELSWKNPSLIRPTWLPSHMVWCAGIDRCLRLVLSFPLVHAFPSPYLSVPHPSPVFTIQTGYNYSRRRLSRMTRNCCPLAILKRGWEGVLPVLAFYVQGIRKLFSLKSPSIQIYPRSEHCLIVYLISD